MERSGKDDDFESGLFFESNSFDEKEIWLQNISQTIKLDGNLDDWTDVIPITLNEVDVFLGKNNTHVLAGLLWHDEFHNIGISKWRKAGLTTNDFGQTIVDWELVAGFDDTLCIGFGNSSIDRDLWFWSASNRTAANFAYDCYGHGDSPDTGLQPFLFNSNDSLVPNPPNNIPIWDRNWNLVENWTTYQNGSLTPCYRTGFTPSGSQADVLACSSWNGSHYLIEFARELDTGNNDDFPLDFSSCPSNLYFFFGISEKDDTFDMSIAVNRYKISYSNKPPLLTVSSPLEGWSYNSSFIFQGTFWDDYNHSWSLTLEDNRSLSYSSPTPIQSANCTTGEWSEVVSFNELALDEHQTKIVFNPLYDNPLSITVNFRVKDDLPPTILAVTNISNQFENGVVSLGLSNVTVVVAVEDNHDFPNNLTVILYFQRNDGFFQTTELKHFSEGAKTFIGTINITHAVGQQPNNYYCYFIEAYDLSNNGMQSLYYSFLTENFSEQSPSKKGIGFRFSIGLIGTLTITIFLRRRRKKWLR